MDSCVNFSGLGPGGWRRGRRGSRRGRGRARTPCGRSGEVRPPQPLLHEARLEVRLRVRGVLHRRLRVPLGETSDTSPPSLSSATSPPHRSVRARPRGRPRAPAPPPRRSAPRRGGGSAPRPFGGFMQRVERESPQVGWWSKGVHGSRGTGGGGGRPLARASASASAHARAAAAAAGVGGAKACEARVGLVTSGRECIRSRRVLPGRATERRRRLNPPATARPAA